MDADHGIPNGPAGGTAPDADARGRVRAAYDADPEQEWGRLESGTQFRLERAVIWHALERHLPPAAAAPRMLDASGGTGSAWSRVLISRRILSPASEEGRACTTGFPLAGEVCPLRGEAAAALHRALIPVGL